RFAKQLAQVLRGSVALGMDRRAALQLAIRCARDSLPPLRLAILDDVTAHPDSTTKDVRQRLGKPRATVDRQLQALQMLNVLVCVEEETFHAGKPATLWRYRLAEGINPDVLNPDSVPDLLPRGVMGLRERSARKSAYATADISGTEGEMVARTKVATVVNVIEPA